MGEHELQLGTPEIKSVGAIAFGPDDVLFVADNASATIFAIDVADDSPTAGSEAFDLEGVDAKLCAFLGCSADDLVIRDMAVHPRTHNVYMSVMRGTGDAGVPVIVKIDRASGTLAEVPLRDIEFSQVAITNAPTEDDERSDAQFVEAPEGEVLEIRGRTLRIARRPARTATITDMSYVDGTLLVAGMSNEEFASNLRRIPFPFTGEVADNSLEIFHVSHGKWETAAPIRTFVPYQGGQSILASYTCTPLVHFSVGDLTAGTKAVGRTVAELGAMNQPLDIVAFTQGDAEYLLVAHSNHPMMKIACADIEAQGALTEPREPEGVPREELDLPGVTKLENLNGDFVLALQKDDDGARHLRSLKTSSL